MPADSILHAFTLSPALPRLGGGSTLVAALQNVMIIDCNRLERLSGAMGWTPPHLIGIKVPDWKWYPPVDREERST